MFVSNYYLNDSIFFRHYQIFLLVRMREYSPGGFQKCILVLHVRGLVVLQNHVRIQTLERSPSECIRPEKSKFAT